MTQGRTKSAFTSTGTLISVVSVLIYCAGFVRVEIKLNEQEERMSEMEKLLRVKDPSSSEVKSSKKDPTMDLTGKNFFATILRNKFSGCQSLLLCLHIIKVATQLPLFSCVCLPSRNI